MGENELDPLVGGFQTDVCASPLKHGCLDGTSEHANGERRDGQHDLTLGGVLEM